MGKHAAEVLRDALDLPAEARAALVDSLIESLDPSIDEGAEEAWRQEIDLRIQQIDSGAVELVAWHAARRRLRDRIERDRAVDSIHPSALEEAESVTDWYATNVPG